MIAFLVAFWLFGIALVFMVNDLLLRVIVVLSLAGSTLVTVRRLRNDDPDETA